MNHPTKQKLIRFGGEKEDGTDFLGVCRPFASYSLRNIERNMDTYIVCIFHFYCFSEYQQLHS